MTPQIIENLQGELLSYVKRDDPRNEVFAGRVQAIALLEIARQLQLLVVEIKDRG